MVIKLELTFSFSGKVKVAVSFSSEYSTLASDSAVCGESNRRECNAFSTGITDKNAGMHHLLMLVLRARECV